METISALTSIFKFWFIYFDKTIGEHQKEFRISRIANDLLGSGLLLYAFPLFFIISLSFKIRFNSDAAVILGITLFMFFFIHWVFQMIKAKPLSKAYFGLVNSSQGYFFNKAKSEAFWVERFNNSELEAIYRFSRNHTEEEQWALYNYLKNTWKNQFPNGTVLTDAVVFKITYSQAYDQNIQEARIIMELLNNFRNQEELLFACVLKCGNIKLNKDGQIINHGGSISFWDFAESPLGELIGNLVMGQIIPGYGLLSKWEEWEEKRKSNMN